MSDLGLMFQNGMQAQGALALGQQVGLDQQTSQADLQAKQLANQQTQQLMPLHAQFLQGQINQLGAQTANTQAELPGIQANSSMLGTKADIESKTAAAQVAQRLSSLNNQIGVDGVQKMGRDGTIALQASQALSHYPPALHKEVFQKLVEQYGGDPSSPTFQGLYNMPDAQFQKAVTTLGQGMVMNSGDYLQKVALQDKELENRKSIAAGNNAATIQAAQIGADSRLNAAKVRAQQMAQTMGIDKAIANYEMAKARNGGTLPQEDQAALDSLKSQKLAEAAAHINPLPAIMTGNPTPVAQVQTPANAPSGIPQGAVEMLKANPNLAAKFDEKYGAGASKSILGK